MLKKKKTNPVKRTQTHQKRLSDMIKVGLSLDKGRFNIHKPINVINHVNSLKTKKKNHESIPTDTEKALNKIQHVLMINVLEKGELDRTHLL